MINYTYVLIFCQYQISVLHFCLKMRRLISKMYIHSYEFKEFNANLLLQTKINLLFLLHIITMENNITL